ncbi:DUF2092 domain-containing protein [Pyxidicoccus parkwayensis]|uniref:DUF2092 domain-containing protein n=1 Tax=Pyxidicoccus parkwayensis TaxID=2813578 RepID=A0ABX7P4H6_9BACT|nr:DUF2092 domain-containing protein [Pyxidicoccus parkwaysis]QSQ25378.1 DUF2092 domain-containing protein [Pyxidicoccus parkwaysis]
MAVTRSSWRPGKGRWGLVLTVLLAAAPPLASAQQAKASGEQASQQSSQQSSQVDPRADRLLRKMGDFLAQQREFSVHIDGTRDLVLESGQKIQLNRSGDVHVQRPDRLRVDRSGDLARLHLYYDGRQLTLFGETNNAYATAPMPSNLDDTLDVASEQLGLDTPGADLLVSNPYAALSEDIVCGNYLGRSMLNGVPVHHLAFRNRDGVDWELWVEDGDRPLPRRYVITTRDVTGGPQYAVTLSGWDLSPRFAQDEFRFSPPADAMKVSFLAQSSQAGKSQGEQSQGEQSQGEEPQGGGK